VDWEARAREVFLSGYRSRVEPTLLPPGVEATEKLLAVFELEKAVYELRYELNNRPDWVPIPVAGIVRLLDSDV
jgi:maltokinase